jgi:DNA-binding NarL/FixJ family response regulator
VLAYGDRRPWPLQELLNAGLRGFVLTTTDCATFIEAVEAVGRGLTWLDAEFSVAPAGAAQRPGREPLTERERQIMGLLAHGLTGREIAARLFLSPATVRTHVQNAMGKLGARTRAQAIAIVSADGRPPLAA